MPSGSNTTVASTANGSPDASANGSNSNAILKTQTSHDHTSYVARARITRAAPPKPATNPLQFIQTKPIFKGVKEPVKRVEEVKKVKEVIKEEPEDWQSNLDNWKVGRRKRVEHIIERVVEVKKLELEEHDRTRRKSKTFAELMEERGSKGRKVSLAIYNEDDANDLSDLGIGTSSASGKSSLSEDYDNHSVISDNQDIEKLHHSSDVDNNSNPEHHHHLGVNADRDYISSPGYDTSSSTAPASSPDLGEYNYESSVHEYKSCGPRALPGGTNFYGSSSTSSLSKDSTPERSLDHVPQPPAHHVAIAPAAKRPSLTKIENRLLNFEIKGTSQEEKVVSLAKKDLPKVDVLKRREMFEKEASIEKPVETSDRRLSADFSKGVSSIKERMSNLEKREEVKDAAVKKLNRMSGDFGSVKERLTTIEKPMEVLVPEKKMPIEVPAVSIKDRLSSLHAAPAVTPKKIVNVIDETPVESAAPTDVVEPHHQESSFADDSGIQTEETTYIHEVSMESVNLVQQLINDLVIHEPVVEVMAPAAVPDVIPVAFTEKPQPAARKETTPVLPRTHEVLNLPDYDNESMFNTPEPNSLEQESSVSSASPSLVVVSNTNINNHEPPLEQTTQNEAERNIDNNNHNQTHTCTNPSILSVVSASVVVNTVTPPSYARVQPPAWIPVECVANQNGGGTPKVADKVGVDVKASPVKERKLTKKLSDPSKIVAKNEISKPKDGKPSTPPASPLKVDVRSPTKLDPLPSTTSPVYENVLITSDGSKLPKSSPTPPHNVYSPKPTTIYNLTTQELIQVTHPTQSTSNDNVAGSTCGSQSPKTSKLKQMTADLKKALTPAAPIYENVPESSAAKNQRLKCQIVGVLEKHKSPTLPAVPPPAVPPPKSPMSPTPSTKSSGSGSSTRSIFDFIKTNLLNETTQNLLEKSTFYVALSNRLAKEDSQESTNSEVDRMLDEELNKLG